MREKSEIISFIIQNTKQISIHYTEAEWKPWYIFITEHSALIWLSILLNIMFHAPMGRFQFIILPIFPSSHPTVVCFFPVGLSLLIRRFQHVLWVFKFLLSPGLGSWQLEFKSLITVIVDFQNFVCCLVWSNQWFELQDKLPRPSNKQNFENQ